MSRGLALLALAACAGDDPAETPWDPSNPPRANIMVVVMDDIGVDKVGAYGEHPDAPATPVLDGLAEDGLLFRNAWAYPTCTPTRTALMTGQHPRVWGFHLWVHPTESRQVPPRAFSVPELLELDPERTWDNSFAGKWHLTGFATDAPEQHPLEHGWSWYAGSPGNLDKFIGDEDREPGDYYDWQKNDNGTLAWTDKYATTDTIDDAIARMEVMSPPWVMFVSLNASHYPLNPPPPELATTPPNAGNPEVHDAIVEAMDTELGRLIAATPEDVTLIIVGDNGTWGRAVEPPWDKSWSKNSLTEGGLRVPLIVHGPLVEEPGESDALVHVLDVFPTLGDNAGVDPADLPNEIHGRSLLPLLAHPDRKGSDVLIAAKADENGPDPKGFCAAARDARFKLIQCKGKRDELYDLSGFPNDGPDLNAKGRKLGANAKEHIKALGEALEAYLEATEYQGD